MRTAAKQAEYALEATATSTPVKGVKGMTPADLLPTFDTVRGTVTVTVTVTVKALLGKWSTCGLIPDTMENVTISVKS